MELIGVAAIALYAALWGALHSLMATDTVKSMARRVFGMGVDRWYRLAYNVVALATFALFVPVVASFPDRELYALPSPWDYLLRLAWIGSVAGVVYAMWLTGIWDLSGLRQAGWAPKETIASGSRLVTSGAYRWVRHPIYFFALGMFWFVPSMTLRELAINIVLTLYMYIGTFFEERRLVAEFGEEYLEYRRGVPRMLPIPWPRGRGEDPRQAEAG